MSKLHFLTTVGIWTANSERKNLPFGKIIRKQLVFWQHFVVHRASLSCIAGSQQRRGTFFQSELWDHRFNRINRAKLESKWNVTSCWDCNKYPNTQIFVICSWKWKYEYLSCLRLLVFNILNYSSVVNAHFRQCNYCNTTLNNAVFK